MVAGGGGGNAQTHAVPHKRVNQPLVVEKGGSACCVRRSRVAVLRSERHVALNAGSQVCYQAQPEVKRALYTREMFDPARKGMGVFSR